jgi:hypothetical protein
MAHANAVNRGFPGSRLVGDKPEFLVMLRSLTFVALQLLWWCGSPFFVSVENCRKQHR